MSEDAKTRGEIMRNAQRLISTRGDDALEHAQRTAERMREHGEEQDAAFWERIAQQIELILQSDQLP